MFFCLKLAPFDELVLRPTLFTGYFCHFLSHLLLSYLELNYGLQTVSNKKMKKYFEFGRENTSNLEAKDCFQFITFIIRINKLVAVQFDPVCLILPATLNSKQKYDKIVKIDSKTTNEVNFYSFISEMLYFRHTDKCKLSFLDEFYLCKARYLSFSS